MAWVWLLGSPEFRHRAAEEVAPEVVVAIQVGVAATTPPAGGVVWGPALKSNLSVRAAARVPEGAVGFALVRAGFGAELWWSLVRVRDRRRSVSGSFNDAGPRSFLAPGGGRNRCASRNELTGVGELCLRGFVTVSC